MAECTAEAKSPHAAQIPSRLYTADPTMVLTPMSPFVTNTPNTQHTKRAYLSFEDRDDVEVLMKKKRTFLDSN